MMKHIVRFMREEEGTTAVEYALMLALITAAIVGSITLLGTNMNTRFGNAAVQIGS